MGHSRTTWQTRGESFQTNGEVWIAYETHQSPVLCSTRRVFGSLAGSHASHTPRQWNCLKRPSRRRGVSFWAHPDWTQSFEVHCEASSDGQGVTLAQKLNDEGKIIYYASQSTTPRGRLYPTHELERRQWCGVQRVFAVTSMVASSWFVVTTEVSSGSSQGMTRHQG
jgi:hypothetical protein